MASAASKTGKSTIYDGENVFVEQLLPVARARLVTIAVDATLREAARLLCADLVHDVWLKMQARELKNVPIAGADGRPLGVLNARDALGVLLQDIRYEESLLRDYVMGVGYR